MSDLPDLDRFEDYPHPRERQTLIGHEEAERVFLDAYRSGRLHHAWILGGPQGIGKATLAYRIARFLFVHPHPAAPAVGAARDLSVDPGHPAARRVAALGHADLAVIRRGYKDGKPRTEIAVEDVRRAQSLFDSTAAEGGWRICIVDSADEWNKSGANALLKTLEEPPSRSLFLIVAHQPGGLLPTIRSRSRLLPLAPLTEEDVARIVSGLVEEESETIAAAAARAEGSVRRALSLLDPDLAAAAARARSLLEGLPDLPARALLDLAGRAAGRAGDAAFDEILEAARDFLSERLHRDATGGAAAVSGLAEIWEKMEADARILDAYNLDRRPFILGLFSDMAEALARSRAS